MLSVESLGMEKTIDSMVIYNGCLKLLLKNWQKIEKGAVTEDFGVKKPPSLPSSSSAQISSFFWMTKLGQTLMRQRPSIFTSFCFQSESRQVKKPFNRLLKEEKNVFVIFYFFSHFIFFFTCLNHHHCHHHYHFCSTLKRLIEICFATVF